MSTRTGKCLCGGVAFTAHGDVIEADACHCSMCRRQGGGGPYFAVQFKGGVTLNKSDTLSWYRGSDHGERGFCTICGASIAWRLQSQPEKMGSAWVHWTMPQASLLMHIFSQIVLLIITPSPKTRRTKLKHKS